MDIEKNIFKKSKINFEKLLDYGFILNNEIYLYKKSFFNNEFTAIIQIDKRGIITGKVIDNSFGEEYTTIRIDNQVGTFVNNVKNKYENILKDIKEKCTTSLYFESAQANRIANSIYKKYYDVPEFLWKDDNTGATFRNKDNENKWYGIIMNVMRTKLQKDVSGTCDVLNVKLDENKISQLLTRNGFYTCYHMNKKKWISIILDDTLSDKEIMKYIEESHKYTEILSEWIVPANSTYFDIANMFKNNETQLWKSFNNKVKLNDTIYIYVSSPYSCIMFKCIVIDTNINSIYGKAIKIKKIKKYPDNKYTFKFINNYGIKAIRGPRRITKELANLLK